MGIGHLIPKPVIHVQQPPLYRAGYTDVRQSTEIIFVNIGVSAGIKETTAPSAMVSFRAKSDFPDIFCLGMIRTCIAAAVDPI
jgi:hypothetical protein